MARSIVYNDKGSIDKIHITCDSCPPVLLTDENAIPTDDHISVCRSSREMFSAGWRCTNLPEFSSTGEAVWVCPNCWANRIPDGTPNI